MADGFLEKHYDEYEKRKAEWLHKSERSRRKGIRQRPAGTIERPEDFAL